MFTPEKEDNSSRFREKTPKTPLFRKKANSYTPEKEDTSFRFRESTPRTPVIRNTKLKPIFEELWKEIETNRDEVSIHIEEAIKKQQEVLLQFENAIDTAKFYDEKTEFDELTSLLITEKEKYEILKSLIDTRPTRSQIIVPYSLF